MKKYFFALIFLLSLFVSAYGQQIAQPVRYGTTLPLTCVADSRQVLFYKFGSSNGLYYCSATNTWTQIGSGGGGGSGTVTSVALTLPNIFSLTGSPITSSGTLAATLASQTQNYVWASPNGSSGAPTFRALVAADMPSSIDAVKIGGGAVSNTEFSYVDGVTSAIQTQLNSKQATLVSATNIKTINGSSILGSGDLTVSGGGASVYTIETAANNATLTNTDVGKIIIGGTNLYLPNSPTTGWYVDVKAFSFTGQTVNVHIPATGTYINGVSGVYGSNGSDSVLPVTNGIVRFIWFGAAVGWQVNSSGGTVGTFVN